MGEAPSRGQEVAENRATMPQDDFGGAKAPSEGLRLKLNGF